MSVDTVYLALYEGWDFVVYNGRIIKRWERKK